MGIKEQHTRRYNKRIRKKRNDATLGAVLFIVALWYSLIGRELLPEVFSQHQEVVREESTLYEVPCTQANMAKLLACTLGEENENEATRSQEEVSSESWYTSYYQSLEKKGIKALKENEALQMVNQDILNKVLEEVVGKNYKVMAESNQEHRTLNIHEVIATYLEAMNKAKKDAHIKYLTLVILATPSDGQIGAWKAVTDQGVFVFKGLILEPLKNKTIQVAVRDQEILGVMKIESEQAVLTDCTIESVDAQHVVICVAGNAVTLQNKGIALTQVGTTGGLTVNGEGIVSYEPEVYGEKDTIKKVTEDTVILEKAGAFEYKDITIMDKTDLGTYTSIKQLPYGTQVAYQKEGNQIIALQVVGRSNEEGLRVVLTDEKGSYAHQKVKLISTSDYDLLYDQHTTVLPAGQTWDSETFKWKEGCNVLRLIPKEDSSMKVLTFSKSQGFPQYKGYIEVTKETEGYQIVNGVNIEDYVAGVIPSEMPTSYGIEALKVQAVAARTYAEASKQSSKFIQYGAQIDDTTASQVYNNIAPNDLAYAATRATEGKVLKYQGELVYSKFFATSCGYTANYGEVWAAGENFPSQTPPYMVAEKQYTGEALISDMKDENSVAKFLKLTPDEIEAFDETSPWFRWQVKLTGEELTTLINSGIGQLSQAYPTYIKVQKDKAWESQGITTIGEVRSIEVAERGAGGNIMSLVIKGSKATIKVSTEYMIRSLLAGMGNPGVEVVRGDGSVTQPMSLLPSAFFVPEITYGEEKEIKQLVLCGGGFGHGVGMSQDGVKGMVDAGYTYEAILKHFYKNVEITKA